MRKLNTSDIFNFARCIKKIGIKEEIKELGLKANSIKDVSAFGFDLVYRLFELATEKNAEHEIYIFLSKPFEMTPDDVASLDIDVLFSNIRELADVATWRNFFKSAVR